MGTKIKLDLTTPISSYRVWKGFCVIRDFKINPAVIREYYIGCDAGFA